ncbi:TetR/AcrR family transcriptional regulator [Streptococcus ratti]|uniref:Transcriptional regulator n=1 Tax=Streptococcus ratti FA-1 = DSM 20564 TaxID=699248 RepID=A0ABN0GT28_STRRT|nr:TetR/AcrR family transcriptional regulator [Streptococcus ratti]EJN93548.1 putative transcriptional regulator [Streptococcus ratti FA-1 = DSM 20564]EMP71833.1 TetR family transcriptional regulator [Streptococcus ratti FA-1 = DSM 20564]QEY07418.1 TetR/AcrR family transcriptional regulator [Streptococcus ratti]VEI59869.1 TetR family transcriptional regulator [Streptococcus mutans]
MKFTDIRYLRTEKLIFDAFTKLLSEKPYEKITVQDIAGEAMINRATFYAHYADKDELQQGIQKQLLQELSDMIDAAQVTNGDIVQVRKAENLLTDFYHSLEKNRSIAKIALKSISQEIMQENFGRLLREKYADLLEKLNVTESGESVPTDFIVAYLTSIFTGTLMWWIKSNFDMPAKELARLVITLVSNGHLTVLGVTINRD